MTDPQKSSNYDRAAVIQYFDEFGIREWERLVQSPPDEVSFYIHSHYLEKYIAGGHHVLEIGAGAGRFTQALARLGARIVVADISPVQLALNRRFAQELGFHSAVLSWQQADACDLSGFEANVYDAVIAYGGLFSYVLDQRDQALNECLRVLRPGGQLLLSVMSMWGTAHRYLNRVLELPLEINQKITSTGDLSPETSPGRQGNYMHMFRAEELVEWLRQQGLLIAEVSASNCLALTWDAELQQTRQDPDRWGELLRMELEAGADPGCWNMGTHILAVAHKVEM